MIGEGDLKKYVAYAVGEIFLVMIGILLALQVNTLNQARLDRISERQILQELRSEFDINEKKLETQIERLKDNITYNKNYLDGLLNDSLRPIDIYEYNTGEYVTAGTINPNLSVITTIISTGEIGLIKNDSLRYLLTQWTDILGNFMENEELHLSYFINEMTPFMSETFLRTYSNSHRLQFSHMTEAEVDALNRVGLRQTKYQSYVVSNIDWLDLLLSIAIETEDQLEKITQLIDQEALR